MHASSLPAAKRFIARPDSALSFGISGILRASALVLYDRSTYSLWTQEGVAIAGPLKGARLRPIASEKITWATWRQRHPATQVMAPPGAPKMKPR